MRDCEFHKRTWIHPNRVRKEMEGPIEVYDFQDGEGVWVEVNVSYCGICSRWYYHV